MSVQGARFQICAQEVEAPNRAGADGCSRLYPFEGDCTRTIRAADSAQDGW
jgi:hypothetical protein